MRFRLRHPLSLEWNHYRHDWTDIWIAVAALAAGVLGILLQFYGFATAGFVLYFVALAVGLYATYRMGHFDERS
jgi:tellurite resistance protein TehA-like permease